MITRTACFGLIGNPQVYKLSAYRKCHSVPINTKLVNLRMGVTIKGRRDEHQKKLHKDSKGEIKKSGSNTLTFLVRQQDCHFKL
jgi:hypothetical protein